VPAFLATLLRALICLALCHAIPTWAGPDQDADPAADLVVSREIFRDPSGRLSLTDVINAPFTPLQGIFAGGYTPDTVWMRLVIAPQGQPGALALRILPAYLNHITLFEPDPAHPGSWHSQHSGNAMPWQDRPYAGLALGFVVHPTTATQSTTYYLRLNTVSNALLQVQAYPVKVANQQGIGQMLWQGLYMAIIVWIILWATQVYWLTRDRVILAFAATYAVYLLYVLTILGYAALLLPTLQRLPELTAWSVTLAVWTSLFFHRGLLLHHHLPRAAKWALTLLLVVGLAPTGLLLAGQTASALKLNSLITLAAGPILFVVALTTRQAAGTMVRRIKIYYGLLLLSLFGYVAPVLGLTTASSWTLYGALIQGLVSALLFAHLLHGRSRQLIDQKNQAQLALTLSTQQLELHQAQLAEQARFTAMLTHELKNPLATIRLSLDALQLSSPPPAAKRYQRIDRALGEIDLLVESCVLSDRLEQGRQPLQAVHINLIALMDDYLDRHPEQKPRVQIESDSPSASLHGDPLLLGVAVTNLIDNALKYAPADSAVQIRLHSQPDPVGGPGWALEVANLPGPAGWPDPAQLFKKYQRGPNARHLKGFGLGLYLVGEIAAKIGGKIDYAPSATHIMFCLWLPNPPR